MKDWRANGGGAVGNGCVGHTFSPAEPASVCGTGRSSIGQIGSPVTRLNTYNHPVFPGWATTSTVRPLCRIVRSFGAVVLS